ncbi:hypothetical protein D9611_000393 [Ephemerocybe angulata]|uniref:cysteine--tRNA ligase n=1 Tax=Ephemerocybe angulata TaxID=980116 RepID=A0A8H5BLU9_9AGAR|nr:hypothetical protein D9611_000393 [Tulosesus angulatus]
MQGELGCLTSTVHRLKRFGGTRNYISQDVIRRVLADYFNYDVHYVMNITDIDDKIISRTRESFFVERLSSQYSQLTQELITETSLFLRDFVSSQLAPSIPELSHLDLGDTTSRPQVLEALNNFVAASSAPMVDAKLIMNASSAKRCLEALIMSQACLNSPAASDKAAVEELIKESRDILGPMLNLKFNEETIDSAQYTKTATIWEARFFRDMSRLNVLPPDTVTRASEYVSEIIGFVQGIMKKGYAYTSNGSVYFDTQAFAQSGEHQYNKLLTANRTREGINQDVVRAHSPDKKAAADFALWKATKPGEPSWPSPWGGGRPGWHIECSAMASSIFGDHMHIHSGGVDLLFPHHTNELAQSEAYHGCNDWVDCFIHIGHLHIDGLKMSKSLKNFISIEDLLKSYTARQLRLAFLLRPWDSRLDFSDAIMKQEALALETSLNNFFAHISSLMLDDATFKIGPQFGADERDLRAKFDDARALFRKALSDSVNTSAAMNAIRTLVSQTSAYMNRPSSTVDGLLIRGIGRWITQMLEMFGLGNHDESRVGWDSDSTQQSGSSDMDVLLPYLQAMSSFRDDVRRISKSKSPSMAKELLTLCDRIREDVLPPLGVQLSDRADGAALIKCIPPRLPSDSKAPKVTDGLADPSHPTQNDPPENSEVHPHNMFKPPYATGLYGTWDDQGIPLTDAEGLDLSKNLRKKLQKRWKHQMDIYSQNQGST